MPLGLGGKFRVGQCAPFGVNMGSTQFIAYRGNLGNSINIYGMVSTWVTEYLASGG